MTSIPGRSPSGVRLAGDDYQHLVTWNEVLLALRPDSDAETITVEARDAGNVDDVVIAYRSGRIKYTQVKHAVGARTPVGTEWLTAPSRSGGPSLLQRFHKSWRNLASADHQPDMRLITDREVDPGDEAMLCLDRRTERLVPEFGSPRVQTAREIWAGHLGIDPGELLAFLACLRFMTGRPLAAEAERADTLMWSLGLNTGQAALDSALGLVRDWVQERERTIDIPTLRERAVDRVGRRSDPGAVLIIEAIGDDPHPEDADAHVRFVERYVGDEPNLRRELLDPTDWQSVVGPELQRAANDLRARDRHRVVVRGALRLPTWFGAGAALRHVHGFTVAASQQGHLWASDTANSSGPLVEAHVSMPAAGPDIAIAVGIATDPTVGFERFVASEGLPVGRIAVVLPRGGAGPESIPDGPAAATMAVAIRDEIRKLLEEGGEEHIHLFLAVPGGLALLLGHRWNALRPTTVYEHLGVGRGYVRTLEIPA